MGSRTTTCKAGTSGLQGTPDPLWQQSLAPISDEAAAIDGYDAVVRSAEQEQSGWWESLTAGGVPFSASSALQGGRITEYTEALSPTLLVQGDSFLGASVSVGIEIEGGQSPGPYTIDAMWSVSNSTLSDQLASCRRLLASSKPAAGSRRSRSQAECRVSGALRNQLHGARGAELVLRINGAPPDRAMGCSLSTRTGQGSEQSVVSQPKSRGSLG